MAEVEPAVLAARLKLPAAALRRRYRAEDFADVPDAPDGDLGIVGQDRAVRAIRFGLRMRRPDYHLFLVGPTGTGKTSYITAEARAWARTEPVPSDWCFIANFDRPDRPRTIPVGAGRGRQFQRDVDTLVAHARELIRQAFDSDAYTHHRQELIHRYEDQQQALWGEALQKALGLGFTLKEAPTGGLVTIPLRPDGQPYRPQEFSELPDAVRQAFAERQRQLEEPLAAYTRRVRALGREAADELARFDQEVARHATEHLLDPLREAYAAEPEASRYFAAVLEDLCRHVDWVRGEDGADGLPRPVHPDLAERYRVHVLVDHYGQEGAPVVVETNPTYANLFGRIEYQSVNGTLITSPRLVKAGSIHLANGGYLILQARDLLNEPLAYLTLKRTLKQGWVRIENVPEPVGLGMYVPVTFQPDPIPVNLTVILIGTPEIFHMLYALDEDFRRIFKVKAEFEADMPATSENLAHLAHVVQRAAEREHWLPIRPGALARLAEYAAWLAEDQERLTTRIGELLSVLAEADAWARMESHAAVDYPDVDRAIAERRYRASGPEDRLTRLMAEGTLMVDTRGSVVGQVNGLAVLNFGDMAFGKPSRITARTYAGALGITNIERQTRQSGTLHTKGVLTLAAYFASRFAQDQPLTLGASIAFEQLYEEIDGDSASSAELYALLSALADAPIDQGIAVTGSVNQKGEVQPIGGVNQKIEGFFATCKAQGLTGRQGVIIPRRNVRQLMLSDEVVQAVEAGQFHIWAVDHVEEGISLLTGLPAGDPADAEADTVMGRAMRRLRHYSEVLRRQGSHANSRTEDGGRQDDPST
ncbi:MAG: AAA family ATPase [Actinomycetia bacterium]|nr:AAA family ATPase [Actinomycetes bacterium]